MADEVQEPKWTPRQRLFVKYYLGDAKLNGAEAARLAGYSEHTAKEIATENLAKPHIKAAIDAHTAQIISKAEVVQRLADIARLSLDDFMSSSGGLPRLDWDKAKASGKLELIRKIKITEESIEVEPLDKQGALNTLAKMHGLLLDRQEITGANGAPLMPTVYLPEVKDDTDSNTDSG